MVTNVITKIDHISNTSDIKDNDLIAKSQKDEVDQFFNAVFANEVCNFGNWYTFQNLTVFICTLTVSLHRLNGILRDLNKFFYQSQKK